ARPLSENRSSCRLAACGHLLHDSIQAGEIVFPGVALRRSPRRARKLRPAAPIEETHDLRFELVLIVDLVQQALAEIRIGAIEGPYPRAGDDGDARRQRF